MVITITAIIPIITAIATTATMDMGCRWGATHNSNTDMDNTTKGGA